MSAAYRSSYCHDVVIIKCPLFNSGPLIKVSRKISSFAVYSFAQLAFSKLCLNCTFRDKKLSTDYLYKNLFVNTQRSDTV